METKVPNTYIKSNPNPCANNHDTNANTNYDILFERDSDRDTNPYPHCNPDCDLNPDPNHVFHFMITSTCFQLKSLSQY